MTVRFKTSRFHISYGPDILFKRVQYKFQEKRPLKLHGKHFKQRVKERLIPNYIIRDLEVFDPNEWMLVTAEVRDDTGAFVNSTWEKMIGSDKYWITIGFGDVVQTIIEKGSDGLEFDLVKNGSIYALVSEANEKLMNRDMQRK